jgi:hypothetical protein
MDILNRSENGVVFINKSDNFYHIEFKNFNFIFSKEQFLNFKSYFENLDGEYYAAKNRNSIYNKSLVIPLLNNTINMMLDLDELNELRRLFDIEFTEVKKPRIPKFDYNFGAN